MQGRPFNDEPSRPSWKLAIDERERIDVNDSGHATLERMEMRRRMIAVIHLDDDAVEPGQFRHGRGALARRERAPPQAFR